MRPQQQAAHNGSMSTRDNGKERERTDEDQKPYRTRPNLAHGDRIGPCPPDPDIWPWTNVWRLRLPDQTLDLQPDDIVFGARPFALLR
jgi:hypothetical protein